MVTVMAAIWYYKLMGETHGPFTANQLREKATAGDITSDAWVRKGHDGKWTSADRVSGLFTSVPSTSSAAEIPLPPKPSATPSVLPSSDVDRKSRMPVFTDKPKTKACPFCAEEIAIAARKCKHCGEFLDETPPMPISKTDTPRKTPSPERTIWEGHPSSLYYLGHWILGVLLLPLFGLGLILIVNAILDRHTKLFILTNKRVMSKAGIISRTTCEVTLADVRNINMRQSLSELLFGLGTVQIGSAGTAGIEVQFSGIANPARIRDQIRQLKDQIGLVD